jgi:hypothetical protein
MAKNSIAAGLTTLLVTTGMSFAAVGAGSDGFTAHAEAQFISAGDEALGAFLETVADQIEGVEVTCAPTTDAANCTKTQASDPLVPLPLAGVTGIELGAANNYATGDSGEGSSVAASGAVSDSGTINTDAPGGFPSNLTVNLDAGELSPITDAVANPKLSVGAIGSSAKLTGPDGAPVYDYSIAGATLDLELPALKTLFDQIEIAYGESLDDVDSITLATICAALPSPLDVTCAAVPASPDPVTIVFPSLDDLFDGVAAETTGGIAVDLAAGTVEVDLATVLGNEINQANFPATPTGTDLLPLVTDQVDTAVSSVVSALADDVNGIVGQILAESSITVNLPTVPPLPAPAPIVLGAGPLATVLQPVLDDLTDGLADITGGLADATPDLSEGLEQLLELRVGVTGLADDTLVGDASPESGSTYSITALQLKVLQAAPAADLRLATSVVGPIAVVAAADVDGPAADDNGNTNVDDGTVADDGDGPGNAADGNTAAIADADSAADADVSATLPDAGAPNLLPFFLLGIALLAFGLGVLLNERRRLGIAGPGNLV